MNENNFWHWAFVQMLLLFVYWMIVQVAYHYVAGRSYTLWSLEFFVLVVGSVVICNPLTTAIVNRNSK